MNVVINSLTVRDGKFVEHSHHLEVEEIVEDGKNDDGHKASKEGLVDRLLPCSEGRLSAEKVHSENSAFEELFELFDSHFL